VTIPNRHLDEQQLDLELAGTLDRLAFPDAQPLSVINDFINEPGRDRYNEVVMRWTRDTRSTWNAAPLVQGSLDAEGTRSPDTGCWRNVVRPLAGVHRGWWRVSISRPTIPKD
jgi:hypothetical protein